MANANLTAIIVPIVVFLAIAGGLFFAYNAGYLDPIIEKIGVLLFKAEAKAEKKKLQAQGLKAGEDFMESELQGSKNAHDLQQGIGGIGDLKKRL